MEELNLPIIEGEDVFKKKYLSMDEYLEFVLFNLKYTVDIDAARKEKRRLTVKEAFSL